MSDGPHKSLPMPRGWKELAKRADKKTYDLAEVASALPHALSNDWKNEVSYQLIAALKEVFLGQSNSLRVREISLQQLEACKPFAAGSAFGTSAVAWAIQMVHEGRCDESAMFEAIGNAALERAYSGFRQVEEHYLRESTGRRADGVRARLENAASGLTANQLGSQLVNPDSGNARPKRKLAIDDGVRLQ